MTTLLLVEDDAVLRTAQPSRPVNRNGFSVDRERMQVLRDGEEGV